MGNIMDYIEWRGDLPFTQSEFNDVRQSGSWHFFLCQSGWDPGSSQPEWNRTQSAPEKFLQLHTRERTSKKTNLLSALHRL